MSVEEHPKAQPRSRTDVRGTGVCGRRSSMILLIGGALAACGGGAERGTPADADADAAGGAAVTQGAQGTAAAGSAATGGAAAGSAAAGVGQPVAPTSLNPGASLRRDTTGAPYDASAADSVDRQAAARATGETDPTLTGGNSGMQLPETAPVSQVGAGPTVTQRDGGGDRYDGGRYAAASAFIDRQGRVYYTDAAGRVMSEAEVRGRVARPAVGTGTMAGDAIATGSVAAYQPNAPDAPGAIDRNASPFATEPGTQSGAQTALSASGTVDRNVAWGGASPEIAAKLVRGTAVAPVAPAIGDSARPASPGGPINPAVPNAVLAPTVANARAVLTLINSAEIEAGRLAVERASTPALRRFAAQIVRDHEAQAARLEQIAGQPALTQAQRDAIGRTLADQRATLANLQRGAPNFDTQWISAQVASHEKALNDLRTLGPLVQTGPLGAYIAQLTAGVQAHLQEAQRLQTRPGSARPAPGTR